MPRRNEPDRESGLPRYLRKDRAKKRQTLKNRFNFSWIGGMAQRLRSALNKENSIEAQNVRRQSEDARRFRESELEARKGVALMNQSQELEYEQQYPNRPEAAAQSQEATSPAGINLDPSRFSGSLHSLNEVSVTYPGAAVPTTDASFDAQPSGAFVANEGTDSEKGDVLDTEALIYETLDADALISENLDADASDAEELGSHAVDFKKYLGVEEHYEEHLDADEIDMDDFDADDLDDEDLDAEDIDADDIDADDLDSDGDNAAEPNLDSEYAQVGGDTSEGGAQSLGDEVLSTVDPSDHEAQGYDAELSSMSVWEGAGFDSYDPAMDVEREPSEHAEFDGGTYGAQGLELDSRPETRRGSSEPPETQVVVEDPVPPIYSHLDPQDLDSEPPKLSFLDSNSRFLASSSLDANATPLESKSTVEATSAGKKSGNETFPKTPSNAGSRLAPSKRYLGFHFGPVSKPVKTSIKSHEDLQYPSGNTNPSVDESREPHEDAESQVLSAEHVEDKQSGALSVGDENLADPGADTGGGPSSLNGLDDNPYAGLWNLFNVGFTVAPSAEPVQERTHKSRYSIGSSEPKEAQASIAEEFHLLAQATHRIMAGSTLFGGAPVMPSPKLSRSQGVSQDVSPSNDQDPAALNRHLSGMAHSIFSNSPLFGGKSQSHVSSNVCESILSANGGVADSHESLKSVRDSLSERRSLTESKLEGEKVSDSVDLSAERVLAQEPTDELPYPGNAFIEEVPAVPVPNGHQGSLGTTIVKDVMENNEKISTIQEQYDAIAYQTPKEGIPKVDAGIKNAESDKRRPNKRSSADQTTAGKSNGDAPKRRRLRSNTVPEPEEESTELKKRKRTERTRPLTRSALRAKKEKEMQAKEKGEDSDFESESETKKRRGGSSQKSLSRSRKKNA